MGPSSSLASLRKALHAPARLHRLLVLASLFALCLFVSLAQTAKPKPSAPAEQDVLQQHYDAARTFAIGGDQQHAAEEYKAFLAEALRRTANARTHEGDLPAAEALFKDAIAVAPENPEIRLDYALLLL